MPYEFTILDAVDEGAGPPLYGGADMLPIRFTVDGGFLVLDGQPYRGTLELANDDEGDLIVVNEVSTSDYLASVVGAEVPHTWEPAALAAQAIAARTYLLTHLGRHRAYDIEGDTRDQAYEGVDTEAPSTIEAVRLTAGVVATYRGAAISALYTANAGGVTESSENVYVSALPYLRSVESPWDSVALTSDWGGPGYRWTRELTPAQLGRHLAVRGLGVGEPQRVELLETTTTGQVMQARVVGSAATRRIGKDGSRYYFGLLSGAFTVARRAEGSIEDVEPANVRRIKALTELGAQVVDLPIRRVLNADRELVDLAITALRFRLPEHFQFAGKGYGHRVGMSQWGAQGMALAGHGHDAILKHYYTGIALTNVGGG